MSGTTRLALIFNDGHIVAAPPAEDTVRVPDDGAVYIRGLHDFETETYNKKPRVKGNPTPETIQMWDCGPGDFVDLQEDWQRLWFEHITWAAHGSMTKGQLITAWADGTAERKALTDNHGLTHERTDYILGLFLDSYKNRRLAQKCLVMGGCMLRVVAKEGKYWRVECLDPTGPAPTHAYLRDNRHLWAWATEVTSRKATVKGTYVVSKWPQLKHYGGWGFPYLVIGQGNTNLVRRDRFEVLPPGSEYDVYVR